MQKAGAGAVVEGKREKLTVNREVIKGVFLGGIRCAWRRGGRSE